MLISQKITALPDGPNPTSDAPDIFSTKAAARVLAEEVMVAEINQWAEQVNSLPITQVNGAIANAVLTGSVTANCSVDINPENTTTPQQLNVRGTISTDSIAQSGLALTTTFNGGETTTVQRGAILNTNFNPAALTTTVQNLYNQSSIGNGASLTSFYMDNNTFALSSLALGGMITSVYGKTCGFTPNAAATTNIANFIPYHSSNISDGVSQRVGTAVSFSSAMNAVAATAAGAFIPGFTYKITSLGTTDFTLIGAVSNTLGLSFSATGVGAGTGTATRQRWGFFHSGTANNAFNGNTRFGGITAPTCEVDVTGDVLASQSIKSSSPSAGIGYSTGAGGVVTQLTSKATAVTLSKVCGDITMHAASLAAATTVSFTLTNTAIAATDLVTIAHQSGGTMAAYTIAATANAGSATVYVRNNTAAALAEALVLRMSIFKQVTA